MLTLRGPFRHYLIITCISCIALGLGSCGGGGGGGGVVPLSPPAFTNLAGTRWNTVDEAGANTCGVSAGTTDSWTLHVLSQSGNRIKVYDERAGIGGAVSGTMSGYKVTYSGSRYAVPPCTNMSARYHITVNGTGTGFAGTATIICNDAPACSISSTVTGTKI